MVPFEFLCKGETHFHCPWFEEWDKPQISSSFIGHEKDKFITVVVKDDSMHQ